MSCRRDRNSEDDRSRKVRFGLLLLVLVRGGAVVVLDLVEDADRIVVVVRDANDDTVGCVGGTNAATDDTEDNEHHSAELVTVRATRRAESLYFAMVYCFRLGRYCY